MRERLEQPPAVGRAGERVDRVLGVRHQAHHVAARVADAGDVVHARRSGSARRRSGARSGPPASVPRRREVAAGRVLDRDREALARRARARERRVGGLDDLDLDLAADEAQRVVRQQRARAADPPRTAPGSRCRSRAPARRRRRTRSPPPSSARSGRSRRRAGSRRRRSRRGRPRRRRRRGRGRRARAARASPKRRQASSASTSSQEPGKRTTPNLTPPRPHSIS